MKVLGKLVATIVVVAVIGFIVGFLVMNGTKTDSTIKREFSGEIKIIEPVKDIPSGDDFGKVVETISGDDEILVDIDSGETEEQDLSKEDKIKNIDEKVSSLLQSGDEVSRIVDNLTLDLVSDLSKNFMKYFKQDELSVSVNVKHGLIEVIPDVDFVENMVYYYDEDGDLILYESVSTTVGGSCKYYFDKGKGLGVIVGYEEDIDHKEEYIGDILNRAKLLYDRYINK